MNKKGRKPGYTKRKVYQILFDLSENKIYFFSRIV